MILGLDFDNTLIRYDELFHQLAFERGLITQELPKVKNTVRDYLRYVGKEDEWTQIQGEVYGKRIREAIPFEGMQETLKKISALDVKMFLVSHKTKTPYMGSQYNLHYAAIGWLREHSFFDATGLGWHESQVFFELTKEEKVQRIIQLGCTHYIDDLPEILIMLPDTINKILFTPHPVDTIPEEWYPLEEWSFLPKLLFS
tara:strand:+ start:969 stop:1568 length:600 start_codon:yes stop_codon:yes gene_type:complete